MVKISLPQYLYHYLARPFEDLSQWLFFTLHSEDLSQLLFFTLHRNTQFQKQVIFNHKKNIKQWLWLYNLTIHQVQMDQSMNSTAVKTWSCTNHFAMRLNFCHVLTLLPKPMLSVFRKGIFHLPLKMTFTGSSKQNTCLNNTLKEVVEMCVEIAVATDSARQIYWTLGASLSHVSWSW